MSANRSSTIERFGTAFIQQIENFERKYHVQVPRWYQEFLLATNGGVLSDTSLPLLDIQETIDCEILYGFDQEDAFDIDYWMSKYAKELPEGAIIIGDDSLKGFLVLLPEVENTSLVYWDDALSFEESSDGHNAYTVFGGEDKIVGWLDSLELAGEN